MQYDLSTIADHLAEALQSAENALRLDQAVYGLDSKDEVSLHELLATHLALHHEVSREVYYPSSAGAKRSHRLRCDLVLSPKGSPLKRDTAPPTLFDPASQCEPGDALWLEIKVAYQFREGGVRHTGYGAQWRSAVVEDLRKMEQDSLIREAALVLIVFNESPAILEKDLDLFELVLAEKEVLAGFRQVRSIPILDRIGHRLCTVALWPTIQR
ncbi:MAG: hypothetical protein ACM359_06960 [Bacillota bacterium]